MYKRQAVGLEPLAVAVFFPDGLVDVIPDKAALIAAVLLVGKFRVLAVSYTHLAVGLLCHPAPRF